MQERDHYRRDVRPARLCGIHGRMSSWLRFEGAGSPSGESRVELKSGLTRLGGAGCEVVLPEASADQLHVWDEPPRMKFVGVGERPRVGERSVEEHPLLPGDRIRWAGVTMTYERDPQRPVLEELAPEASAPDLAAARDPRGWRRVRAGIMAELGLAESGAVRRWQDAVRRGTFDPDACAEELLSQPLKSTSEDRITDRTSRLERDLLMAPLQRGASGAGRAVRGAARTGLAYLMSQVFVAVVFASLFAVVLLLVRLRWSWDVNAFLDGILDLIPG